MTKQSSGDISRENAGSWGIDSARISEHRFELAMHEHFGDRRIVRQHECGFREGGPTYGLT